MRSSSTGEWNSMTGSSCGWIPVSFDLTAFAGQNIELVVSYVTDPSTGEQTLLILGADGSLGRD